MPSMRSPGSQLLIALFLVAGSACGSDDNSGGGDAADAAAVVPDIDAGSVGCEREARAADGLRYVVVARPYGDEGAPSTRWDVLALSAQGELTETGESFSMRRATDGVVHFTPDGSLGLVAQDDGSVGVFRIDDAGAVTVLHEALEADFYASDIAVSETGDAAYVIDSNWRENGGGVYQLTIGCDDAIRNDGLLVGGKLPRGIRSGSSGTSVITASDFGDSPLEQDVHVVDGSLGTVASAQVFPDSEAIVSALAVTAGRDYALIGDASGFSGVPNRVAVARISDSSVEAVQVLSPIEDPFAIVASPHGDTALVVSGFGDAIYQLSFDSKAATPFSIQGELAYTGSSPELPADAVLIERGELLGLVLVAETRGVRLVQFAGEGTIIDLGLSPIGESYQAIVGAIGVQP